MQLSPPGMQHARLRAIPRIPEEATVASDSGRRYSPRVLKEREGAALTVHTNRPGTELQLVKHPGQAGASPTEEKQGAEE